MRPTRIREKEMKNNSEEKTFLITESKLKQFVDKIKENVSTGKEIDVDSEEWKSELARFFELVNHQL